MTLSVDNAASAAPGELEAARSGSVVAALPGLSALRVSGDDAEAFLQGQLTCDVSAAHERATYGAWCSPQGRMLASFLLWRAEPGFVMALRADIAAGVQQRLSRYVLRSKVRIEPATLAFAGCSGPEAPRALREAERLPQARLETASGGGDTIVRLDESRLLLALAAATAAARVDALASRLTRVGAAAWEWLDIRRGIPWIVAATQDRLVPQMANLERIGGVSFAKGCYTGQEIVARAQHRGTVKRRMFLAHVEAPCGAGDELRAEDLGDQAAGLVVNAAPSPDGGFDLLASVNAASRESSVVHLRSLDGPALRFLPDPAA